MATRRINRETWAEHVSRAMVGLDADLDGLASAYTQSLPVIPRARQGARRKGWAMMENSEQPIEKVEPRAAAVCTECGWESAIGHTESVTRLATDHATSAGHNVRVIGMYQAVDGPHLLRCWPEHPEPSYWRAEAER